MKPDSYCRQHGEVKSVFAEMVQTWHCPVCHDFVEPLATSPALARKSVEEQGIGE